ncbi:sulfotransferase [Aurantiacibacter sp. MUD11]|uniref:tetratricopeptide repeat-containing sulfotransferase family protein n=1 Tax=Aurantiacibacter sp. MUD11 TaxID=3003265 RepID=UPI0022AB2CED|nr:sulfotransferase [Aurantiacibacter sp. MUD11]WAT17665.1 sulfotransferase [Aurantiacibacter sp. MUD11]
MAAAARHVQDLQSAMQLRDRERLVWAIGKLVSLRAPMGEQWRSLADLALGHGEVTLARQAIDLFVEARGHAPAAIYLKVALLEQAGALAEAREIMRSLPENVPDPASNAYSLGTVALYLGDMEQARAQLERAVRLDPRHGAAWLSLSASIDLAEDTDLANAIVAAHDRMAGAPPQQAAPYCHALGNALAAQGDHDAAFAAFARGAAMARALQPYDRESANKRAEASLEGFTAEAIEAIAQQQSEPTDRAIFVTGLPRSGTTLVEQILASHSKVADGAEISRLRMLASDVRSNTMPAIEAYLARHEAARAARLWSHLLAERFPAAGRVVDKSLDTSHFIGLAAATLPDAPLVWLTRDRIDCAFSCFRTYFPAAFGWSCDLEDIAWQFRIEDRLRTHWQEVLGDKLLVVPLEELAEQPAVWTRRILAHCGLPQEQEVFVPHETRRAVSTASTAQVRQPVSRARVGSADRYRAQMQPFMEAYFG